MNRKFLVSAVTVLGFMTSASAFAAEKEGVYVTLGATSLSSDVDLSDLDVAGQNVDFGSEDISVIMLTGRLGYRLNDFFALEGEAGFGLGGDDFDRTVPVNVQGNLINVDTNVDLKVEMQTASLTVSVRSIILPITMASARIIRSWKIQALFPSPIRGAFRTDPHID